MVTRKDRGSLLIKRALLSVQMRQQLGRGQALMASAKDSGEPLWGIWVILTSLACAVVHITLTTVHCYNWFILVLISPYIL